MDGPPGNRPAGVNRLAIVDRRTGRSFMQRKPPRQRGKYKLTERAVSLDLGWAGAAVVILVLLLAVVAMVAIFASDEERSRRAIEVLRLLTRLRQQPGSTGDKPEDPK